jgi:hypothetical protein
LLRPTADDKTARSIAEQTNLLALNAKIEEISSIVAQISDRQPTIASAVDELAADLRTTVGRFTY